MFAEYKHSLRRLLGQIIGWTTCIAAYGLMMVYFYPYYIDMGQVINEFLNMMPAGLTAVFESLDISGTPMGYIDVYYFSYMHFILAIFAISSGAGMLARDEETGILDLVMAYPISRTSLFFGRLLAWLTANTIILTVGWLCWALPADAVGLRLTALQLLRPFLSLSALLLVFFALSLLLSTITPSARIASMISGMLLVGNFLIRALSNIIENLDAVLRLTPLGYYQAGRAIEGLNLTWFAGLMIAFVLIAFMSWMSFIRRDIRVSGERDWALKNMFDRKIKINMKNGS